MSDQEPLAAELHAAETTLKSTLEEACGSDVSRADTGELIRVEEMLAIASDAAKRAISIRRRFGRQPDASDSAGDDAVAEHRFFSDDDGVEWMVRAVHPAQRDPRQSRLLGSFQQGWLAFESESGKRRLTPIPDAWEQLDDAGLRGLWDRAEPATRRDDRPR